MCYTVGGCTLCILYVSVVRLHMIGDGQLFKVTSVEKEPFAMQSGVNDDPTSKEPFSGNRGQTSVEMGGEEGEQSGSKSTEELLDGLVVVFTDYQDCMDEDTMDKWKLVYIDNSMYIKFIFACASAYTHLRVTVKSCVVMVS